MPQRGRRLYADAAAHLSLGWPAGCPALNARHRQRHTAGGLAPTSEPDQQHSQPASRPPTKGVLRGMGCFGRPRQLRSLPPTLLGGRGYLDPAAQRWWLRQATARTQAACSAVIVLVVNVAASSSSARDSSAARPSTSPPATRRPCARITRATKSWRGNGHQSLRYRVNYGVPLSRVDRVRVIDPLHGDVQPLAGNEVEERKPPQGFLIRHHMLGQGQEVGD